MNPTAIHDYIKAGLFLVPIPPVNHKPVKGPTRRGWNCPKSPDNPDGYSNDPQDIVKRTTQPGSNIGLALGPSKVATIDIDDMEVSRRALALADIDLDILLSDSQSVQIISREGRGKLLYRVPEGFECCSTKLVFGEKGKDERAIFELRYKGSNGHTAQDVLPPSVHPDTNRPYELVGDITKIPPLPQALANLWKRWEEWKPVLQSLDPHYTEAINKAEKQKNKARAALVEGAIDPIATFNERHSIHEVLTSHGYKQKGKRYIRPGSTSGIPGIVLLDDDHIYSHGGDMLADGHKHDAFDVHRLLSCGGNWKQALEWDPEITRHNQRVWQLLKGNTAGEEPLWEDPPVESYADDPESQGQGHDSGSQSGESSLVVRCVADVETSAIGWLWKDRIALGKITFLVGDPDEGKSYLTTAMAACVTRGDAWPDGAPCERGSVILISAEDDIADTIKPRLEAHGADLKRVHFIETVPFCKRGRKGQRLFSIQEDLDALGKELNRIGDVRFVDIDPISAFLGDCDSHVNAEVRGLMGPFAKLVAKHNAAFLAISHLNKGEGNALYRITGSLAFVALARAAFLLTHDKEKPERRLLLPIKNNLSGVRTGLAFSLVPSPHSDLPMLTWETDLVNLTANDVLAPAAKEKGEAKLKAVEKWLRAILANGPVLYETIEGDAKGLGISIMTLKRAKGELDIKSKKQTFSGKWEWFIPTPKNK